MLILACLVSRGSVSLVVTDGGDLGVRRIAASRLVRLAR